LIPINQTSDMNPLNEKLKLSKEEFLEVQAKIVALL
jgi:hypothetical protein